jgi:hypothetical protein
MRSEEPTLVSKEGPSALAPALARGNVSSSLTTVDLSLPRLRYSVKPELPAVEGTDAITFGSPSQPRVSDGG